MLYKEYKRMRTFINENYREVGMPIRLPARRIGEEFVKVDKNELQDDEEVSCVIHINIIPKYEEVYIYSDIRKAYKMLKMFCRQLKKIKY